MKIEKKKEEKQNMYTVSWGENQILANLFLQKNSNNFDWCCRIEEW